MGERKLLDCTLRDGGYLIDWKFGHDNLVSVFERVIDAGVDFIEVGFLDERRMFDMDRSITPTTKDMDMLYAGLDKKGTQVVGMIDYGTCGIENIQPCEESFLDGIRVIFKKHLRKEALSFCAELKALGYKVFAQLVSVTSYSDEEMLDLIQMANEVQPYVVSMVDTYGLMHQNNLKHYFDLLDKNLDASIGMGYHGHNNFQMAYANCIEMLSHKTDRTVLVDATIYGMGKSAGNAPIELVAMHMNDAYGKNYKIAQFLEAIDTSIMNFYHPATWGYNMFFFLAASNDCHPSYVSYLMDKRTLSVKAINRILGKLRGEKKLLYDRDYIEHLYFEYQNIEVDDGNDIALLGQQWMGKEILILGSGVNIHKEQEKIDKFIEEFHPEVISINFLPEEFPIDYLFLSNSKRYLQLATALSKKPLSLQVISTSNVTKTSGQFNYTLNYSSLIDETADIIDNPFLMVLKVMIRAGVKRVALGGFDGYHGSGNRNYVNARMEYLFDDEKARNVNLYVKQSLKELKNQIEITFLTSSLYES